MAPMRGGRMISPFEGGEVAVGANNWRRTLKAASLSDKPIQNNGNEEQMREKVTKQPKTCIPLDQAQGCSPKPMDAYGRRGVIYKEGNITLMKVGSALLLWNSLFFSLLRHKPLNTT